MLMPQRTCTIVANFDWKLAGPVNLDWRQRLVFPALWGEPGVYMFEVGTGIEIWIYVAETENLARRMQQFRTPGLRTKTAKPLNRFLTDALRDNTLVTLWTINDEIWVNLNGEQTPISLKCRTNRRLLESCALMAVDHRAAVSLNRLLEK